MSQLFKVHCGSWALSPELVSRLIREHFDEMGAGVHLVVEEAPQQPMYLLFAAAIPRSGGGIWDLVGVFETLIDAQEALLPQSYQGWAHIVAVGGSTLEMVSVNYDGWGWSRPLIHVFYDLETS